MENSNKIENLEIIQTMRRAEVLKTVNEATDGSWRYVRARVMDGDEKLYLQVRNRRKEWGRLVRAEPYKTRGFSKTFKNLLDKGVPPPTGYRLSKTSFLGGGQDLRLVKRQAPREPTFRQLLHPNLEIEKPNRRNTTRQFDVEFYVQPVTFRSDPLADHFYIGTDRYEKYLLGGQDLTVVADTDVLKREVWKKWSGGWKTFNQYGKEKLSGLGILHGFAFTLQRQGDEAQQAGKQIENYFSFFDKNPAVVKIGNWATEINVNNKEPIDYVSLLVREDAKELPPMLDSRYTDYFVVGDKVEEGVVYRNLKGMYKPNMCMLSVILEAFRRPEVLNRLKKKKMNTFVNSLSYEGLVGSLFDGLTVENVQNRGVSVQDVVPFFEKWGLSLFVYDVYGQRRFAYVPEKKNGTIRPQRVSVMLHERHAYLLNKGLDHLEKVECPVLERGKKSVRKQVKFYNSRKGTDDKCVLVAWSVPEAVQVMNEVNKQAGEQNKKVKEKKKKGLEVSEKDQPQVTKVYVKDAFLPTLVVHLRHQYNIRASVTLKNTSQIGSVRFGYCQFVSMASPTCGDVVYKNKQALVHLIKCQEKLYKGCFGNPAWRSVYHKNTYRLLTENKPSPLWNNYLNTSKKGYSKYDVKKCYSSIVRDAEWILRLNGFDKLETYDGRGVEDTCLYYVKKKSDSLSHFPLKRFSLVYGKHLNSTVADNVDILAVLRPSHRVSNVVAEKYKEIFEDKKLIEWENQGVLENARKWLLNTTTGTFGQHVRTRWTGKVFDSVEEASTFVDGPHAGVRYFRVKDSDGKVSNVQDLFLQYAKVWHDLTDGFMLFHHYVVEACVVKMLELKQDLECVGYTVYDVKTDCCDVDYNPEAELKFKEMFGSKWFKKTGTEWEQTGGLSVEHFPDDKPLHTKRQIVVENEALAKVFNVKPQEQASEDELEAKPVVDDEENEMVGKVGYDKDGNLTVVYPSQELNLFEETKVEEVSVENEWDTKSVHAVLGKRCSIEAVMPGSGKSYISETVDGKMLFVCPNNKIVTNLLKKGLEAVTLDHLFGYYLQRHAESFELEEGGLREKFNVGGQETNLSNYTHVTFEEVLLHSVDKIYAIDQFVKQHGDRFEGVYLNYDENQNRSPDEKLANIPHKEVKNYKLKICRGITGRYIVLREMKRNTNKDNVKHYKAVFELAQRNDTKGINQYLLQNCRVVSRLEDIDTDMCVAYTNPQCDKVNSHTYKRLHGEKPLGVGMTMIYKGKSQMVGKCKSRFFKNDEYKIVEVVKDEDKVTGYTLEHPVTGRETVTPTQLEKLWKLPYCWTGHSTQGSTIDVPYTIDLNCCFNNAEWLWTAVTRCTDWSQISVFYSPLLHNNFVNKLKSDAQKKINGYAQQDLKAGRFISKKDDYVDVDWVIEHLHEGSCCYCGEPYDFSSSDQFSVDRIDNSLPHLKSNCHVCCKTCNSIKR